MNMRNWLILGLALVLAFTLTVGLPGVAQVQENDPGASYAPDVQDYGRGYSGYGGSYAGPYCPMWSGYGHYAPTPQDRQSYGPRSWNKGYRGYRGAWCPWNVGHAGGYQSGWGSCW